MKWDALLGDYQMEFCQVCKMWIPGKISMKISRYYNKRLQKEQTRLFGWLLSRLMDCWSSNSSLRHDEPNSMDLLQHNNFE